MGLSALQRSAIQKVRSGGSSNFAVTLTDDACAYLASVVVDDLGLTDRFPEVSGTITPFFTVEALDNPSAPGIIQYLSLIERVAALEPDAVTYFTCLASLYKARLKYKEIIERQALPTMDQVGPRGLLQFGTMGPRALTGFMVWRKLMFDLDNRAGQETGYLFEPIITSAVGGVPFGAVKSPIKRHDDPKKGRQIDCVRDLKAYEFKMRVTIAASGQGRWKEELAFPRDCKASGYTPVLVVFDPTENPKLAELTRAFHTQGGEVYVGDAAWRHLDGAAGATMANFIERYIRVPIQELLKAAPDPPNLPDIAMSMNRDRFVLDVGGEKTSFPRARVLADPGDPDALPEDVDDELPGP